MIAVGRDGLGGCTPPTRIKVCKVLGGWGLGLDLGVGAGGLVELASLVVGVSGEGFVKSLRVLRSFAVANSCDCLDCLFPAEF